MIIKKTRNFRLVWLGVTIGLFAVNAQGGEAKPTPVIEIYIGDSSVIEGTLIPSLGSGQATSILVEIPFNVTLTATSTDPVEVAYRTRNGTAKDETVSSDAQTILPDYFADWGAVTFEPGETAKQILVDVLSDQVNESNETFFVDLFDPVGAPINKGTGTATLVNDDAASPGSNLEPHPPTGCGGPWDEWDLCSFYHEGSAPGQGGTPSTHIGILYGINERVQDVWGNLLPFGPLEVILSPPGVNCYAERACALAFPWPGFSQTWYCEVRGFSNYGFAARGRYGCFVI